MRPDLGQVERIEAIRRRVLERHDLHFQLPCRVLSALDAVEQVAAVEIRIGAGHGLRFSGGEVLNALLGLEVVLDPDALALGVDPHVGVAAVAVHVPPGAWRTAVGHQDGHLVVRRGLKRPEVPLGVVAAQAVCAHALL